MQRIAGVLSMLLVVAGCASERGYHGVDPRPSASGRVVQVGAPFTDFSFKDQSGKTRRFGAELGDFTILGFTGGEHATYQAAGELVETILKAHSHHGRVHLVGAVLHDPAMKDGMSDCHLVEVRPNLGTICDGRGEIRKLYGAMSEDWLVVIGPDRTVVLSGPASSAAELSRELGRRASTLAATRKEAAFASYNPHQPFN